jgi:hypothetical protein
MTTPTWPIARITGRCGVGEITNIVFCGDSRRACRPTENTGTNNRNKKSAIESWITTLPSALAHCRRWQSLRAIYIDWCANFFVDSIRFFSNNLIPRHTKTIANA